MVVLEWTTPGGSLSLEEFELVKRAKAIGACEYAVGEWFAKNNYMPQGLHLNISYRQHGDYNEVVVWATETHIEKDHTTPLSQSES